MQRCWRQIVTSLMVWLMGCGVVAQAHPHVEFLTQQQPPYNMQDAQGRQSGIALDVVRCAMNELRRPFRITFVPWLRAQRMVEQHQADAFFPASRNAERDRVAVSSQPIAPQVWRWYLLKTQTLRPDHPAFRSKASVGAYLGSNMHKWLLQEKYRVEAAPLNHDQLLLMLLARRIDAVLASDLAMDQAISAHKAQVKIDSIVQQDRPLGVYFGKRFLADEAPDFLDRFNRAVTFCRRPASARVR